MVSTHTRSNPQTNQPIESCLKQSLGMFPEETRVRSLFHRCNPNPKVMHWLALWLEILRLLHM